MLTQNNLKLSIKNLHLYSSVGFFPTGIGTDGLPTEASAKEKRRVWRFLLTVSFLYTIFMAVRLKHVLQRENGTNKSDNMYTVSLHAIMLVGGAGAVVIHTLLWRSSKAWLNFCLLKDLLQGLPKGNVLALKIHEFERLSATWSDLLVEQQGGWQWDSILIRSVPVFYPVMGFCLEAAKWAAPDTPPYSLRSILPPVSIATVTVQGMCAIFEVILLINWIGIATYALFLQLLFLQRCHDDLTLWLQRFRWM